MTWSYSGDPSSNEKDKYRFLIGDTDENDPILKDKEIEYILDSYSDETVILYHLFQRAADIVGKQVEKSLGPQSENPTNRQNHFKERANYYKQKLIAYGISSTTYNSPKSFKKGMHDNV